MGERLKLGIPSLRFDSESFAPDDRFEAWRAAIAPIHDTVLGVDGADGGFLVRTNVWNLGGVVATHGTYSAQRSERSAALIRRAGESGYRVSLAIDGPPLHLASGDDRLVAAPGELVVADPRRPSTHETRGTAETMAFYLSRSEIDALVPPSRPDMAVLKGPLATLLRDHLIGVVGLLRNPATPPEAMPGLARATIQLSAAALAGSVPPGGEARGAVEDALRRRVVAFVEERLLDPTLNQDLLCRTFHMSRATLYRLFQPLGGVATFVQERRLARVHALLGDPAHHYHLGRLAETHGFSSQARMSRAYRARYGTSPTGTVAATVPPPSAVPESDTTFRRWVRGLGA